MKQLIDFYLACAAFMISGLLAGYAIEGTLRAACGGAALGFAAFLFVCGMSAGD